MAQTWADVPVEDPAGRPERFVEFPDNGYQLCVLWGAWTSGQEVVRVPAAPTHVIETCIDQRTGQPTVTRRPRTGDDDETVDAFVNGYLDEAGIPPRPRHHRWYLRCPDGLIDEADPSRSVLAAVQREHGRDESAANVLRAARVVAGRFS